MAQIKQEPLTDTQKLTQLQKEIDELRSLLDRQSNQLARQQKFLQLVQFSWLTFFFLVFNLILAGVFVVVFMKDKGWSLRVIVICYVLRMLVELAR